MNHKNALRAASEAFWDSAACENYEDVEAAIKAFLHESGMVIVPREPTNEMVDVGQPRYDDPVSAYDIWREMINSSPNPFQTPEESREKK